jgi:hypothetical protein
MTGGALSLYGQTLPLSSKAHGIAGGMASRCGGSSSEATAPLPLWRRLAAGGAPFRLGSDA